MTEFLSSEKLYNEYIKWIKVYGAGRNNKDLRFGQYIHSEFLLVPDVAFYTENTFIAYNELFNKLQEYQR